ncbi:alpha/beta hydrolase [Seohaeicola zhoushanensis]|uniref:Putative lipase LipH (Carboxylesterase) n=1 Tax=Seohaeicola zhoushanensis TaxID=1569283 RepID=A0A8J3H3X0_9RHOB|nr:alpha/beta hydrolase [Seohaeicola zhoushanensis]GHF74997.1 putative lipase LipH (carboxylesterase) [Seohaeicola zhoushanensis]
MNIDPAYLEFLADPRNTVRPPPPHIPLEKVRNAADRAMHQGKIVDLPRVEDHLVDTGTHAVRFRLYHPAKDQVRQVIFFFHGGGFVWGSIDTHDGICRRLAALTDAAVISVDYRLSPETPFPGARDDCLAVIRHALDASDGLGINKAGFALCGDSAGGQIAVSTCAALVAADKLPLHLALIYPTVDPACNSPSQTEFADGPLLTRAAMRWFWDCYLRGVPSSEVVIDDEVFRRFPPTCIVTAENDPLRDEGEMLAARLRGLNIPVEVHRAPGLLHGFLSLAIFPTAAVEAFDILGKAIDSKLAARISG